MQRTILGPIGGGIPGPKAMFGPALQWVLAKGGVYLAQELKDYLSGHFHLTPQQLTQMLPSGRATAFNNRVDWVNAYFTLCGVTTSADGRPHKTPKDKYYLTEFGFAAALQRMSWLGQNQYGPRNAPPDPRCFKSS